jgi:hypothetical protein
MLVRQAQQPAAYPQQAYGMQFPYGYPMGPYFNYPAAPYQNAPPGFASRSFYPNQGYYPPSTYGAQGFDESGVGYAAGQCIRVQ